MYMVIVYDEMEDYLGGKILPAFVNPTLLLLKLCYSLIPTL